MPEEGKGSVVSPKIPGSDLGTVLAHERTDLALGRSNLAAERTLMAWIRTALSMISFGFTIGKLGQVLNDVTLKGVLGFEHTVSMQSLAFFLVILGTGALLLAALQHRKRVLELRKAGLNRELSISFYVSIVLALIGLFAMTSLAVSL